VLDFQRSAGMAGRFGSDRARGHETSINRTNGPTDQKRARRGFRTYYAAPPRGASRPDAYVALAEPSGAPEAVDRYCVEGGLRLVTQGSAEPVLNALTCRRSAVG